MEIITHNLFAHKHTVKATGGAFEEIMTVFGPVKGLQGREVMNVEVLTMTKSTEQKSSRLEILDENRGSPLPSDRPWRFCSSR